MKRTSIIRSLLGILMFGTLALQSAVIAQAEEALMLAQLQQMPPLYQQQLQPTPPIYTAGRMKLYLETAFGGGFDSIDVGTTTRGDRVSISGGGGFALGAGFGYGIARNLDLDVDLGWQVSEIMPAVSNADGTFTRSYLLATVKRKLPISETGQFKVGVGIGAYNNGKLDVNAINAGGGHTIVKYKNALGFQVTGEFEQFIGPNTSIDAGMRMYFVSYKADSVTQNDVSYSVNALNSDVRDLNGSGLDFMVSIVQYF